MLNSIPLHNSSGSDNIKVLYIYYNIVFVTIICRLDFKGTVCMKLLPSLAGSTRLWLCLVRSRSEAVASYHCTNHLRHHGRHRFREEPNFRACGRKRSNLFRFLVVMRSQEERRRVYASNYNWNAVSYGGAYKARLSSNLLGLNAFKHGLGVYGC